MNSVIPGLVGEVNRLLDDLERDPDVRCLVITGSGRAFCAGSDLQAAQRSGQADPAAASAAFVLAAAAMLTRIERLPRKIGVNRAKAMMFTAEQVISAAHFHSADRQEGIAAFAEKRSPRFTGR